VAVDVARRIFEDFSNKQTLVVGAGEMAQLVCQYLRDADARKFAVTTRTLTNARALADACTETRSHGTSSMSSLFIADIVITATACPTAILTKERIAEVQKKRHGRLLFVIDLAVPRNVEPSVAELNQVFVYDIDALGQSVEAEPAIAHGGAGTMRDDPRPGGQRIRAMARFREAQPHDRADVPRTPATCGIWNSIDCSGVCRSWTRMKRRSSRR
jgi:glutamyl-tRNA reductase